MNNSPDYEKGFQDALDLCLFETAKCPDKEKVTDRIEYLYGLFVENKVMRLRAVFGILFASEKENESK